MPHINRLSYCCAARHEHLSEMGREVFSREMSRGDGAASVLAGWLNAEEPWPKREIVGQPDFTVEAHLSPLMRVAVAAL